MNTPLTGQPLADAYAKCYADYGKVWAWDLGGGWICLRGECTKFHPDYLKEHPNATTWTMAENVRYGEARQKIAESLCQLTK